MSSSSLTEEGEAGRMSHDGEGERVTDRPGCSVVDRLGDRGIERDGGKLIDERNPGNVL